MTARPEKRAAYFFTIATEVLALVLLLLLFKPRGQLGSGPNTRACPPAGSSSPRVCPG